MSATGTGDGGLQGAVFDALTEGVFTVDRAFRVTMMNAAAEELTGVDRGDALGQPCRALFRADCCDQACALAETLRTGRPIQGRRAHVLDATGTPVPVSISTSLLRDARGRVVGGVETFRDLSQIEGLRRALDRSWRLGDLIARSAAMQRLVQTVAAVADSDATVLIQGESGTGKELVARALHHGSPRRDGPFVAVNCGALPDALLESELFGHRRGAFTGADRDRPGRFAHAAGGTLMLDEIGEISPAMQVRLLRVLQERRFEPLGADAPVAADVRVIAASNRDLRAMVAAGDFRQDLFYRLDVVTLELPPLRRRGADLPPLIEQFLARWSQRTGRPAPAIDAEALALLLDHDYPGNVRELENLIERACVLSADGHIGPDHLPDHLRASAPRPPAADSLAAAEADALQRALDAHGGNRLATARSLGIHKTTLYRKMRRLGLQQRTTGGAPG